MRPIDADAFKAYIRSSYEEVKHMYRDDGKLAKRVTESFCEDIDEQPTIDPQKWIPCNEKMPENEGKYLVWLKDGFCETVHYWNGLWNVYDHCTDYAIDEVIAWMPLPGPYKEEKNGR